MIRVDEEFDLVGRDSREGGGHGSALASLGMIRGETGG